MAWSRIHVYSAFRSISIRIQSLDAISFDQKIWLEPAPRFRSLRISGQFATGSRNRVVKCNLAKKSETVERERNGVEITNNETVKPFSHVYKGLMTLRSTKDFFAPTFSTRQNTHSHTLARFSSLKTEIVFFENKGGIKEETRLFRIASSWLATLLSWGKLNKTGQFYRGSVANQYEEELAHNNSNKKVIQPPSGDLNIKFDDFFSFQDDDNNGMVFVKSRLGPCHFRLGSSATRRAL